MPFSTEFMNNGEYVLVRFEGMIRHCEFDQAHAAVKKQLKERGWGRLLVDLRQAKNRIDAANVYSSAQSTKNDAPWVSFAILYPPHGKDVLFAEDFKRRLRLQSFTDQEEAQAWLADQSGHAMG